MKYIPNLRTQAIFSIFTPLFSSPSSKKTNIEIYYNNNECLCNVRFGSLVWNLVLHTHTCLVVTFSRRDWLCFRESISRLQCKLISCFFNPFFFVACYIIYDVKLAFVYLNVYCLQVHPLMMFLSLIFLAGEGICTALPSLCHILLECYLFTSRYIHTIKVCFKELFFLNSLFRIYLMT